MPLVYLIVAVSAVQASRLAVADAAREAGRAFATGDTSAVAAARARAAVRIALADQGLADDAIDALRRLRGQAATRRRSARGCRQAHSSLSA